MRKTWQASSGAVDTHAFFVSTHYQWHLYHIQLSCTVFMYQLTNSKPLLNCIYRNKLLLDGTRLGALYKVWQTHMWRPLRRYAQVLPHKLWLSGAAAHFGETHRKEDACWLTQSVSCLLRKHVTQACDMTTQQTGRHRKHKCDMSWHEISEIWHSWQQRQNIKLHWTHSTASHDGKGDE